MDKTQFPRLKEEAERNGQFYPLAKGPKNMITGLAIFCVISIFCAFLAIPLFIVRKSGMWVTDEGILIKWFGTRFEAWDDFEPINWEYLIQKKQPDGSVKETMTRPLMYKLKSRKTISNMAVQWSDRPSELIAELKKRARLENQEFPRVDDEVISTAISDEAPLG